MAKKFDPSKYEYSKATGKLYVKGGSEVTNPRVLKQWRESMGHVQGTVRTRSKSLAMPSKYNKFFNSSSLKSDSFIKASRPLGLTGGKNPEYGWHRAVYGKVDSPTKDSSTRQWGSMRNQLSKKDIGKSSIGKGVILHGSKEWTRHLQIAIHYMQVNAEKFRVVVGHRAIKVFQESFKYQQFWSTGSHKWPALSNYTLKKRAKRRTGSRILKEYGDLYRSIKLNENESKGLTRIYTDIVKANPSHHKKLSVCYAGYHNNPRPGDTYGKGFRGRRPKPYIQRQFMGHSDKIDTFALSIMKQYLFDNVFLIKKV